MGPSLNELDIRLHSFPSAAVSAALPRGHAALAFVDVGVGFVDRTADVFAVDLLRIYGFDIPATVAPLRPYRHLTAMW